VYAADENRLKRGFDRLSRAIVHGAQAYPSLDRKMLLSVVSKDLGEFLDLRVFDAVVGSQLRMGRIDRVACTSESGKMFRVLFASERMEEFEDRCTEVADWLRRDGVVAVRDVRRKYFGDGWGCWSSAAHVGARLVMIGRARHIDRFSFAWPRGLEDAVY
jgi:hypothetical protein